MAPEAGGTARPRPRPLAQRLGGPLLLLGLLCLLPLLILALVWPAPHGGRTFVLGFIGLTAGVILLCIRELYDSLARTVTGLARHLDLLACGEVHDLPEEVHLSTEEEALRLCRASHALTDCLAEMHLAEYLSVERTRDAERLKSQFLANMSHDLRSPLNAILGFSELLERGLGGTLEAEQQELIVAIRRRGNELLRLINQILDTAKLEAGRFELHREWIPAAECVAKAAALVRRLAGNRPVDIRTSLAAGLPPVHVDVGRVAQALAWLMVRDYLGKTPLKLSVTGRLVAGDPPLVELRIDDESPQPVPLTAAMRALLEGPRQPGSLIHAMASTGLGLPLARRMIEMHGGRLTAPGQNGRPTFVLSLPAGTPARGSAPNLHRTR